MKQINGAVLGLLIFLSACSTTTKPNAEAQAIQSEAQFATQNGSIHIVFDGRGNWVRIDSTATQSMVGTHFQTVPDATQAATMKAKAAIAEFISTEIKSEKTYETLTKSFASHESDGEEANRKEASDVASKLQNNIRETSKEILRGVHVSKQSVEGQTVAVTVEVDQNALQAAKSLKKAMQ